jgi:hypothetical protein
MDPSLECRAERLIWVNVLGVAEQYEPAGTGHEKALGQRVIVIGASLSRIDALSELIGALPADFPGTACRLA